MFFFDCGEFYHERISLFAGPLAQPLFFCLKEVVLIFFFLDTLTVVAAPANTAGGVSRDGLVTSVASVGLPGELTAI